MKINPERLHELRKRKLLTRQRLSDLAGIHARTIQRLENDPDRCQKTREDTLNRLAEALEVEPGVLTGELPLPEFDKAPVVNSKRVQIGAQIAPKARLAYDLVKRQYGVSATDIINMAPFFFALLAEGSLAWRREKLKEAEEAMERLDQIRIAHRIFCIVTDYGAGVIWLEEESIAKADLFGDYLLEDHSDDINLLFYAPFDPSQDNPFASYLRKLADDLDIPGVVNVDGGDLSFGSPVNFPDYDICSDELNHIANNSQVARRALEIGYARLSEIPEELMAEDADEEREKWLKDELPDLIREILEKDEDILREMIATNPKGEKMREALDKRILERPIPKLKKEETTND